MQKPKMADVEANLVLSTYSENLEVQIMFD